MSAATEAEIRHPTHSLSAKQGRWVGRRHLNLCAKLLPASDLFRDDVLFLVEQGYTRVKVCPDSGAIKFVAPPHMFPGVEVNQTEASRRGRHLRDASGGGIRNLGEKVVKGKSINGANTISTWQVAKVVKPLAGLIEMVRSRNRVVFDQDDKGNNVSYIYDKSTGTTIPIEEVNGGYEFDLFVQMLEEMEEKKQETVNALRSLGVMEHNDDDEDDSESEGEPEVDADGTVDMWHHFMRLV